MSRWSLAWLTPSWLMLLLMDRVYCRRGSASPVIQKPDEKPPRKNSSDIWRSAPAQKGQDPVSERAVRLGATPMPMPNAFEKRYCMFPKRSVCCVVGSDQSDTL